MEEIIKAGATLDRMQTMIDMVLNAVSERTRPEYARALNDFMVWYKLTEQRGLTKATFNAHVTALKARGVTDSSINQRLAALRKFASEAADNGLIDYATAFAISKVKNISIEGGRLGNWLTQDQANQMLNAPDVSTLKGKRDRAVLAVMLGGGLRREEVCSLTVEHLQQREGRWVILDLKGKRNKTRTIPIKARIKVALDLWLQAANIQTGYIFRPLRRGDHVQNKRMNAQAIWNIVKAYSPVASLAPHDLRRTFAKLANKGGSSAAQIQKTLGHESVKTTEVYLGTDQDLQNAPSDCVDIEF